MNDDFYRALEDRFRGSRELVRSRLSVYLPAVRALAQAHPGFRAFDAGCGRGEWLELLGAEGIPAYGMDIDPGMLATCADSSLETRQGDAIAHLQMLPPASLLVVSAFHVAEHLVLADLQALLAAARRALVPEGLLILETPNPENLVVGAANFHIDPTHRQPLPAQLLAFLVERAGFAHIEQLRLQHEPRLADMAEPVRLHDVLAGVSPDYAILATPAADVQKVGAGGTAGVSLVALADRYDGALQRRFTALREEIVGATDRIDSVRAQAALAETQAAAALARADIAAEQAAAVKRKTQAEAAAAEQAAAEQAAAAEAREARIEAAATEAREARIEAAAARAAAEQAAASARQQHAQLAAVHASRSWRITRPLRWLMRQWRARFPRH